MKYKRCWESRSLFIFFSLIVCWGIVITSSPSRGEPVSNPRSYKEAYHMAYKAILLDPQEAIKIIKEVHRRNIPVRMEDTFYVTSIASLALRPVFREFAVGKELLQKVVAVKANDYRSNAMLFALFLVENSPIDAKRYAMNLLMADYEGYIRQMEPASQSRVPIIKEYLRGVVDLYRNLYNFFLSQGNEKDAERARAIAGRIRARYLKK